MAIVVEDDFNRADTVSSLGTAPTGQVWVNAVETWQISSNRAQNANTAAVGTALIDAGTAELDAAVTVRYSSGSSPGLIFRAQDDLNRLALLLESTRVALWQSPTGGGAAGLISGATFSHTRVTGTAYRLRVRAVGSVLTAYLDDVQIIEFTLGPGSTARFTGPTYINVGLRGQGADFDDLIVESLVTTGEFAGVLPLPIAAFPGSVTGTGQMAGVLPMPTASLVGDVVAAGALATSLPVPVAALGSALVSSGELSIHLPLPTSAFVAEVTLTGQLAGGLPMPTAALSGEVASRGARTLYAGPPTEVQGFRAGVPTRVVTLTA